MKQWVTKTYKADFAAIAKAYNISEIMAELLVKRGLFDYASMNRFLFPEKDTLYDATQMAGLTAAAELLGQKIREKKKIKVIGDYDVDGVMSAYILCRGIELLGGDVSCRLPHRVRDGYGLRDYMAREAFEEGCDMLLTCDNGISAAAAVQEAKSFGMTVIVTDHHEVPKENGSEVLPPADVIVDPKQQACQYPFAELCGAGIAYKLMAYLFDRAGRTDCDEEFMAFAAVATVCDVVPLTEENRVIVTQGLKKLPHTKNNGMRALLRALALSDRITTTDLGFRIGPCINAAGRLADAMLGFSLFWEKDSAAADAKAQELAALNEERKELTAQAAQEAVDQIEQDRLLELPVLLVYLKNCHESVAGIVAGRIREKYYRPTLIITESRGMLKGSARSIPGYHMQAELNRCSSLLVEYGGHAMAAGFSLLPENLEKLRQSLNENCTLTEEDFIEKLYFDKEVALADMTEDLVRQLEYLEPYGEKNEKPLFAVRQVAIASLSLCGKENRIARVKLLAGGKLYQGVDFRCEACLGEGIRERYGQEVWEQVKAGERKGIEVDLLYRPEMNRMYGGVEFRIVACR